MSEGRVSECQLMPLSEKVRMLEEELEAARKVASEARQFASEARQEAEREANNAAKWRARCDELHSRVDDLHSAHGRVLKEADDLRSRLGEGEATREKEMRWRERTKEAAEKAVKYEAKCASLMQEVKEKHEEMNRRLSAQAREWERVVRQRDAEHAEEMKKVLQVGAGVSFLDVPEPEVSDIRLGGVERTLERIAKSMDLLVDIGESIVRRNKDPWKD